MAEYIIFILLGVVMGILLCLFLWEQKSLFTASLKFVTQAKLTNQSKEKQRNLEMILGLFEKHETLTNAIIRQELGFDDRVVVNYMDELEKLGKVRQIGKTGVDTHYELVR